MSLVLLVPVGLLALASLLLPLLIHLSRRPHHRRIDFAAMRWLQHSEKPRRRLRFEDLPLLLARLVLLGLLAWLLAQPLLIGDWREGRHWVLLDPQVASAQAMVHIDDPDARVHWLLPGFPQVTSDTAPADDAPRASLLREFDDGLADADRLTVLVPPLVQGLDAQRIELRHAVDWQIVPAAVRPIEPIINASPRKVALRHAAEQSAALRYLRAALASWSESAQQAWLIDDRPADAPLDADTRWLIWLDSPLPDSIQAWVERGGRVLVNAGAPSTATAIWRNEKGDVIASVLQRGKGRIIHLLPPFEPAQFPALLDAGFPERLKSLFAEDRQGSASDLAENVRPRLSGEPGQPLRTPLDSLLTGLVVVMFMLERVLASRRRSSP